MDGNVPTGPKRDGQPAAGLTDAAWGPRIQPGDPGSEPLPEEEHQMPKKRSQENPIWDGVRAQPIDTWAGFLDLPDRRYYFRGHSSTTYTLKSSLERFFEQWGLLGDSRRKAELFLIRDFRRRLHHYVSDLPGPSDDLEWLAAMQHYGTPTRLLDFTYSKYVAAFFAVRDALDKPGADSDCEVWGIKIKWLINTAERTLNSWRKGLGTRLAGTFNVQADGPEYRRLFVHRSPPAMILPCTSFRLNERLAIQKGAFLCPLEVRRTFDQNLAKMRGWDRDENIVRYRFPGAVVREFIQKLHHMNVTDATLFPGLDGFARSLALYQSHVARLKDGEFLSKFRRGVPPW